MSDPEIVVFEPEDRVSLRTLSDEEYFERFGEYVLFLSEMREDTVVAGAKSTNIDYDTLCQAFIERFPEERTRMGRYWVRPGPAGEDLIADFMDELPEILGPRP